MQTDWLTAHLTCRIYGYDLVSLTNSREQEALLDFLKDKYGKKLKNSQFVFLSKKIIPGSFSSWFGATNLNSESDTRTATPFTTEKHGFYWFRNGQPIDFPIQWFAGEPSAPNKEHCLELTERNRKLGFNDISCSTLNLFICQMNDC